MTWYWTWLLILLGIIYLGIMIFGSVIGIRLCKKNNAIGFFILFFSLPIIGFILGLSLLYNSKNNIIVMKKKENKLKEKLELLQENIKILENTILIWEDEKKKLNNKIDKQEEKIKLYENYKIPSDYVKKINKGSV